MTTAAESMDNPLKSICCLLGGVFVFSIQDVIIKWISGNYPVHEIVLVRSVFAVVPIIFLAHLEGGLHLLRTRRHGAHIIRSILMFSAYVCFYLSLAALPLAETVSLFYTAPIFITILSVIFLGEKVGIKGWMAVLVGFSGVIVMLRPTASMIDPAALLALLTAFLYSIKSIFTRRLGETESGVSLAFYPTIMNVVFSAILSTSLSSVTMTGRAHPSLAFLFRPWQFPSQGDLFLFVLIGFISAAGYYFLSQAYRLAQPSTVAPFEYVQVPMSVLWGYVFFKDVLEPHSVIGMAMIVGSGLYILGSAKLLANKYVLNIFKIRIKR